MMGLSVVDEEIRKQLIIKFDNIDDLLKFISDEFSKIDKGYYYNKLVEFKKSINLLADFFDDNSNNLVFKKEKSAFFYVERTKECLYTGLEISLKLTDYGKENIFIFYLENKEKICLDQILLYNFGVFIKESGRHLGTVGFKPIIDSNGILTLGGAKEHIERFITPHHKLKTISKEINNLIGFKKIRTISTSIFDAVTKINSEYSKINKKLEEMNKHNDSLIIELKRPYSKIKDGITFKRRKIKDLIIKSDDINLLKMFKEIDGMKLIREYLIVFINNDFNLVECVFDKNQLLNPQFSNIVLIRNGKDKELFENMIAMMTVQI